MDAHQPNWMHLQGRDHSQSILQLKDAIISESTARRDEVGRVFSPTAECYGVSAQYRFRCVLGELGRFREKTGSGKVPGGLRESSGNRSGNRLGSRFQEPVPRFHRFG